jgi:hypothetical protein
MQVMSAIFNLIVIAQVIESLFTKDLRLAASFLVFFDKI